MDIFKILIKNTQFKGRNIFNFSIYHFFKRNIS